MKTNVNWIKSCHYYNRYLKLIHHYKINLPEEKIYTEKHHIIPRSMGGNNDKNNLVKLTPRAHYLVHYMLWKAYYRCFEATYRYEWLWHVLLYYLSIR